MNEKFPEAAKRHLEDSKLLLEQARWDNSAYLAGYVIECSLKSVITTPQAPSGVNVREIGHDIETLAGLLERMASSSKGGFRRTVSGFTIGTLHNQLRSGFQWKAGLRYAGSGYIDSEYARKWWKLAKRIFSGTAKNLCGGT